MTGGAYFSYGELRQTALELAIGSADDVATDAIVARANAYFQFLVAGHPHD